MTPQEFQYIKRAVEELETGEHSLVDQHKILMTMSQITKKAAVSIEDDSNYQFEKLVSDKHFMRIMGYGTT